MRAIRSCLLLLLFSSPKLILAQPSPSWTTPIAPFRIADNLYYVGSQDLASYLVVTPNGNILINANWATSPPQLRASVEALGLHWNDIRILLNSQAHADHMAGAAEVIRETHAKNMVMDGDVDVVETGGRADFLSPSPNIPSYAPVHVDRVLHDGDPVSLGGVTLTAHKTAGHTRGCTTWTMRSHLPGEPAETLRNIVIVGGTTFGRSTTRRYPRPSRKLPRHRSGFPAYLFGVACFALRRISGCPRRVLRHAHQTEALSARGPPCFHRPRWL